MKLLALKALGFNKNANKGDCCDRARNADCLSRAKSVVKGVPMNSESGDNGKCRVWIKKKRTVNCHARLYHIW